MVNSANTVWIAPCKTLETLYRCRACGKTNDFGAMGEDTLKKHASMEQECMKENEAVWKCLKSPTKGDFRED